MVVNTGGMSLAASLFSFGSKLEIGSAECHVGDLFVSLRSVAGASAGRGISESRGSAADTGAARPR